MTLLQQELHENNPKVTFHTNRGDITMELYSEQAPKTVKNFLELAKKGYYTGTIFHRVINEFMIQGGDPTGTGCGGESIYGGPFEDEFSKELFNFRGALSMANAGPNTNGSQFFIVQAHQIPNHLKPMLDAYPEEVRTAYLENGGTLWLDQRHTVFGQVIEGMDVVDEIAGVSCDMNDRPLYDVTIDAVDVNE